MKLCRLLHLLAALSLLLACLHTSGARAQGAAEQPQQDAAAPDYDNELLTDVPLDLAAGADADTDADADEAAVDADTPLLPTSNAAMDLPEPGNPPTCRVVQSCRACPPSEMVRALAVCVRPRAATHALPPPALQSRDWCKPTGMRRIISCEMPDGKRADSKESCGMGPSINPLLYFEVCTMLAGSFALPPHSRVRQATVLVIFCIASAVMVARKKQLQRRRQEEFRRQVNQ